MDPSKISYLNFRLDRNKIDMENHLRMKGSLKMKKIDNYYTFGLD